MIQVFSHSEAGGHAHNEDAFEVRPHPSDPDCLLWPSPTGRAVRPAALARPRSLAGSASKRRRAYQPAILATRPDAWEAILRQADAAVAERPGSRVYHIDRFCIRNALLRCVQRRQRRLRRERRRPCAILTDRQCKNPPVGCGGARPVGFAVRLKRPWTVLVLSDGVWKYAGWDRIADSASRLVGEDLMGLLRTQAGLPGSGRLQDDFTVVAIQDGYFAPKE